MEVEFVNAYIEALAREVGEHAKTRVLRDAQIAWLEKKLAEANEKLAQYTAVESNETTVERKRSTPK